jgi:Rft protein
VNLIIRLLEHRSTAITPQDGVSYNLGTLTIYKNCSDTQHYSAVQCTVATLSWSLRNSTVSSLFSNRGEIISKMSEGKGTKLPDAGTRMVFSTIRWTMLFNMLQRVVTFLLNQSMIAWTSPEIFGIAAISLELLLSTLLFLSREGVRLACLRETIVTLNQRQLIVNVSTFCIIILYS